MDKVNIKDEKNGPTKANHTKKLWLISYREVYYSILQEKGGDSNLIKTCQMNVYIFPIKQITSKQRSLFGLQQSSNTRKFRLSKPRVPAYE